MPKWQYKTEGVAGQSKRCKEEKECCSGLGMSFRDLLTSTSSFGTQSSDTVTELWKGCSQAGQGPEQSKECCKFSCTGKLEEWSTLCFKTGKNERVGGRHSPVCILIYNKFTTRIITTNHLYTCTEGKTRGNWLSH